MDRYDTRSISQDSTSEHHHQGLDEMSDEQLQAHIEEMQKTNQILALENQIFDKYHKKLEPFLLATIAGTSSSSLATTPSGSMYDLNNLGGTQSVTQGSTGGGTNRYRKRSKSRSTQGDFRMKLTADQKLDIVSKEIDEIREDMRKASEEKEKNFDSFEAVLEEADLRLNEMKIELHEFQRDVLKAGYNPVNKKVVAEKMIKYFDNRIKQRDSLIDKLKFKNEIMRKNKQKMKADLKEKEELGEVLHEVDFKQLKIENKQFMAKIDEKNNEMIKLKKTVGSVTQVLNHNKKLLNQALRENESILNEIKTRLSILNKLEAETEIVKKEHSKEEHKNRRLRAQLDNYQVPEVNDYVLTKDYLYNLQKELKVWERKVEIAEMALKTNKQTWIQMKSISNHDQLMDLSSANKLPSIHNANQLTNSAF